MCHASNLKCCYGNAKQGDYAKYAKEVVRVSNVARHKRGSNFGRFPFTSEPRDQTIKRGFGSRSFIVATRLDFADAWKTTITTTIFASGGVDEADIAYLPHTDILKNNTTNLSNDSLVTSGVKPITSCGHAWELQASWIHQWENKHIVKNR